MGSAKPDHQLKHKNVRLFHIYTGRRRQLPFPPAASIWQALSFPSEELYIAINLYASVFSKKVVYE
jgi:hypothetical protein